MLNRIADISALSPWWHIGATVMSAGSAGAHPSDRIVWD